MRTTNKISTTRPLIPVAAGMLSLLAYAYLCMNSQQYGQLTLPQFYSVMIGCAVLSVYVWIYYERRHEEPSLLVLFGFAIAFRLVGVFAFPIFEDDFYRYLWDGRMVIEHGSPYGLAPASFFSSQVITDQFDEILGLINYPDIPTIYGPVNQWVFALSYLVAPGEIWPLQIFYALVDLLVISLLLQLARPNMVLLYAWSPLVIKEFAFTAHPDVLGVLLLLGAYLLFQKSRFSSAAVLLVLAAGLKIFAVLLVPFILGLQWRAWAVFCITAILIGLPWGILESWVPAGLSVMGESWVFNSPLYLFLQPIVGLAKLKLLLFGVMLALYAGYYFNYMRAWPTTRIRGDYLFALLLIFSPVINPWYLGWLLPFAVIYPSIWAWVASVSVLLAYASGINLSNSELANYDIPHWLLAIEFTLIALAAILQPMLTKHWRNAMSL